MVDDDDEAGKEGWFCMAVEGKGRHGELSCCVKLYKYVMKPLAPGFGRRMFVHGLQS